MLGFKEFIRLLMPPVLWELAKRLQLACLPFLPKPEWEAVHEGWRYVQTHPEVKGWNVEGVLRVYQEKWPRFLEMVSGPGPLGLAHESDLSTREDLVSHNIVMSFGYVLSVAAGSGQWLKMLDWGGGIGHYFHLARQLHPNIHFYYHCRDVPLLAEQGRVFCPEQHFSADDACLQDSYDLVMASGSMHFSEDWKGLLGRLAKASRGHVYVTLLPTVTQTPSFVFVQRPYSYGYETEYLGWCVNRDELLTAARECSLLLVREMVMGHRPFIVGAPEQNAYRGFLFSKQSVAA